MAPRIQCNAGRGLGMPGNRNRSSRTLRNLATVEEVSKSRSGKSVDVPTCQNSRCVKISTAQYSENTKVTHEKSSPPSGINIKVTSPAATRRN
ncbi:unnamed protein product [Caretta caretta]